MSTIYIAPYLPEAFRKAAKEAGWTPARNEQGVSCYTDGTNWAYGTEVVDLPNGAEGVMFCRYGSNDVSQLVEATGAVSDCDPAFDHLAKVEEGSEWVYTPPPPEKIGGSNRAGLAVMLAGLVVIALILALASRTGPTETLVVEVGGSMKLMQYGLTHTDCASLADQAVRDFPAADVIYCEVN